MYLKVHSFILDSSKKTNQLKYPTQEEMDWSNEVNSYYGLYANKLNMDVIYC